MFIAKNKMYNKPINSDPKSGKGREYDSCKDSPCRWSSAAGCRHPLHPKNDGGFNRPKNHATDPLDPTENAVLRRSGGVDFFIRC